MATLTRPSLVTAALSDQVGERIAAAMAGKPAAEVVSLKVPKTPAA
jgi:hypothetical protein